MAVVVLVAQGGEMEARRKVVEGELRCGRRLELGAVQHAGNWQSRRESVVEHGARRTAE